MQLSTFFLASLVAALSAVVVASADSVADAGLVAKRAALQSRMHARAHAGHGALKKRAVTDAEIASKERIQRAQFKPTKTDVSFPGMEKRQLGGIAVGNTGLGVGTGSNGLGCVCTFGVCVGLGCSTGPSQPQTSQYPCQGQNYDGCNPGTSVGVSSNGITYTSSVGISQCCQSGYSCQKLGPFGASYCLNLPFAQLYNLNQLISSQTFSTQ